MSDTSTQATEVLVYKGIPIVTQEMKTDLRNEGRAQAITEVKAMVKNIKHRYRYVDPQGVLQTMDYDICIVSDLFSRLDAMLEAR